MFSNLTCKLVIAHTGKFLEPAGVDSEAFIKLLKLLDAGNSWGETNRSV